MFEGRSKKLRVSFDHLSREMITDLAVTVSTENNMGQNTMDKK